MFETRKKGRPRGSGKGSLIFRQHKNSQDGTWSFSWHEYVGDKRYHRRKTLGTTLDLPTREAAEDMVQRLRIKLKMSKMPLRHMSKTQRKNIQYVCSEAKYKAMVVAQEGCCAICHTETFKLCIDHNHETGQVRGLLCASCNSAIGFMKDNPAMLRSAADYLERCAAEEAAAMSRLEGTTGVQQVQ